MQGVFTTGQIQKLQARYAAVPALVLSKFRTALDRTGQQVVNVMRVEPFAGGNLHTRTAALKRGFHHAVSSTADVLRLIVANSEKYARIQEKGGVVVPKKAKALAIPIGEALTGAGVPRYPGGPRSVPGLFLLKRAGKNALLVRKDAGGGITPLFVLVKSVTIPPRLGFGLRFRKLTVGPQSVLGQQLRQAGREVLGVK